MSEGMHTCDDQVFIAFTLPHTVHAITPYPSQCKVIIFVQHQELLMALVIQTPPVKLCTNIVDTDVLQLITADL
jgi:hypothetical protein